MRQVTRACGAVVWCVVCALLSVAGAGCEDAAKLSEQRAIENVQFLVPVTESDVQEVRTGMPKGATHLLRLWQGDADPLADPQAARVALDTARGKVQDLRVAKSTFFAVATLDGTVIRNDQDQDLMATRKIFPAFEGLKAARGGKYAETLGHMLEADGVKGKPDAQWVAAQGLVKDGKNLGYYVTGWAWSLYAKRLEYALKSHIADTEQGKQPLFYVFVLVEGTAYGTAPAPQVDADAIQELKPWSKARQGTFSAQLTITGRDFGLAVLAAPALGEQVALAVLRSET
jgi:hypothetical protein